MTHRFIREDIDFYSDGTRCSGWLYLPATRYPAPVIVMAHGLGALRDMRLDVYAQRFAQAGLACFLFDYRNFGASEGQRRQLINVQHQLTDWRQAIEWVKREPRVDATQLYLFGTSFSGGHVIQLAAERQDIIATIAQCPYTDTWATTRAVPFFSLLKMMPYLVADIVSMVRGYRPVMLKLAGNKGEGALMTVSDHGDSASRMIGEANFINQVPARTLLEFLKYSPGKLAREVTTPIYFALCKKDTIAPASASLKWAQQAANATIKEYDCAHFEIYLEPMFEAAIQDYIEFYHSICQQKK